MKIDAKRHDRRRPRSWWEWRARRPSRDRVEIVLLWIATSLSASEIGERYGVSKDRVMELVSRPGIKRFSTTPHERMDEVEDARKGP